MQFKYAVQTRLDGKRGRGGRPQDPNSWISGPDLLQHEMYYAWSKHKSQAHYRKEQHDLTWADWQAIWHNPHDFLSRGRQPDSLVLTRRDIEQGWTRDNVEIITRLEQLRRTAELSRGRRNRTYRGQVR